MMPVLYVLVRHGESEGNVAVNASKDGDNSFYTDKYVNTPGTQWRLTRKGEAQAAAIGSWLKNNLAGFHRYYVSPYVRTRMTAVHMGLPSADWRMNRSYREREWGEIDVLTREMFKEAYPNSARVKKANPLYWAPPGGESIADVGENRVRNILDTLHRECDGSRVIAVTHGENIQAHRMILERWSDEKFAEMDASEDEKVLNCQAYIYSRDEPGPLNQLVRATPVWNGSEWVVEVSDTLHFNATHYSNSELAETYSSVSPIFDL